MTADPSLDIKAIYEERRPHYQQLKSEALFTLNTALEKEEIKVHNISSRVKSLDSLLHKTQRKKSVDPFRDIEDLLGIRIVCLFRSDIETIGAIIQQHFHVHSEDNKIAAAATSFGYLSLHFIVSMDEHFSGPGNEAIKAQRFEIQVRTLTMDAWASISHYLDYKSDKDVPSELRKDFYALSGLFYVADTHFELFYRESEASKKNVEQLLSNADGTRNQEINFDTLQSYLRLKFPKRERTNATILSAMVASLLASERTTIDQLDPIIEQGMVAFLAYERENPPSHPDPDITLTRYADVGLLKLLLAIVDPEYAETYYDDPEVFIQYRSLITTEALKQENTP